VERNGIKYIKHSSQVFDAIPFALFRPLLMNAFFVFTHLPIGALPCKALENPAGLCGGTGV
jgi:hypothetical protein